MAIITLTRGIQSGGRELAHCLEKKLGYKCLSREVISQCARKYNIVESELYDKLIEAPKLWKRLTREHQRYLIYIQCSLIEAAKQDNIIYHGYAGQLFLRGVRHALKIRLEAPLEDRTKAEMNEHNVKRESASSTVLKYDEQRSRWMKFLYDKDWHDPSLYDLVINLESISIETACGMVERLVNSDDFKTTEASMKSLNNLSLECEVNAALATDDKLWNQEIKVRAHDSVVTLYGISPKEKIRDAIVDLVRQVKGVKDVVSHINLSTDPLKGGIYGHD